MTEETQTQTAPTPTPTAPIPTEFHNFKDIEGNPGGGYVEGLGIKIEWQNGPRKDAFTGDMKPANGAFVEDAILAAKQRLEFFQESQFKCRENSLAITKLEEALHWLGHRTADRQKRGVEGLNAI